MKTSKKNTNKKSSTTRSAVNRFKVGQRVTYNGKKMEVRRAYVYNGLPLCIVKSSEGKRHMVSANSLK